MLKNSLRGRHKLLMFSFMIPALALMAVFVIGPMIWGVYISFTNQALVGEAARNFKFIGLSNYMKLFRGNEFITSILRSLYFLVGSVVGQFLLGFGIALIIKRKDINPIVKGVIATGLLLPWAVPEMATAFIWISAYEPSAGLLNLILKSLGLPTYNWVFNWPMISVIIANIWRGTGFTFLLLSAALESVPFELYEAAEMDGASEGKKLIAITLPLIRYQVVLNLLLITLWTSMVFGLIFVMTGGGPFSETTVASIFIYQKSFIRLNLSAGSAASVIMLLIGLCFAFFYLKLSQVERRI